MQTFHMKLILVQEPLSSLTQEGSKPISAWIPGDQNQNRLFRVAVGRWSPFDARFRDHYAAPLGNLYRLPGARDMLPFVD